MTAQKTRTREQGYIDGFDTESGLTRVHRAMDAYKGDLGMVANSFFRILPKLEVVKVAALMAVKENPYDSEEVRTERHQAATSLLGTALTGLALEDQGFYRGLNKSNIFRAVSAYKPLISSGESIPDYLRQQSEALYGFADHFPDGLGIQGDLRKSYWHGTGFSYMFARQIGMEAAK